MAAVVSDGPTLHWKVMWFAISIDMTNKGARSTLNKVKGNRLSLVAFFVELYPMRDNVHCLSESIGALWMTPMRLSVLLLSSTPNN